MIRNTLTRRAVNGVLHVLNYSQGQIMSFDEIDGAYLLQNWDRLKEVDVEIDQPTADFFSHVGHRISSRTFRSALVNLGMEFGFPTVTNLELNRRCVLRCQHCYIPTADLASKSDSAFEENNSVAMPELFDRLHRLGVFLIVLTGGEVFLNRSFQSLLRLLMEREFVLEIFSSLQFLPGWFGEVDPLQSRIGRVQTSVYSLKPAIHDEITAVDGSLDRTLRNLEALHEKGFYVEVATPLMKSNFDERHEIERHFQEAGIKQSFAWPIVSEYYGGIQKKNMLNISKEQFLQFCLERPDYLIKIDPASGPAESICAAGKAVMSISGNGDVYSCSQYPKAVGNIHAADIESVYRSPEMRRIAESKKSDLPEDALPYNYCMGNNYSETGDPFAQADVVRESLAFYDLHMKRLGQPGDVL